jgi:CoA:oxalate CoA-transferase
LAQPTAGIEKRLKLPESTGRSQARYVIQRPPIPSSQPLIIDCDLLLYDACYRPSRAEPVGPLISKRTSPPNVNTAKEYQEPPQALSGIKLVELPCLDAMPFLAAAMAGKAFADMGAEVIKVEPPRTGSRERSRGPFRDEVPDPETGGLHLYLNANKLGVTLDFGKDRARELLFKLLADTDVLLNPNPPALNGRLGLDWKTLTQQFPRLIVTSLTFFGADSPYRDFRGGDLIATHMSGVGYETPYNQVTDPEKEPPLKPAGHQGDYLTGFTAAAAVMCALFHRNRTGFGQHVDVSQWLALLSMIRPTLGIHTHESRKRPICCAR